MRKIKKIALILCMLIFTFNALSITSFASNTVTIDTHRGAVKGSNSSEYAGNEMGDVVDDKFFYQLGKTGKIFSMRMWYMSNGQYAYCVEYQEPTAKTYSATEIEQSEWWQKQSREKLNKLTRITLYGYPNVQYSDVPACDHYVATQTLVWETCEGKDLSYLLQTNASKVAYQRIKKAVENHTSRPSFDKKTVELKWDKNTKTYKGKITDTNNELKNFSFNNVSGVTMKKNGNTLEIESNRIIEKPLKINADKTNIPPARLQAQLCYENSTYQTLISGTRADPVRSTFNIQTESVNMIKKISVNTGKFLSGATLELIRVSNGEIVEEWISDSGYKVFPQLEVGERYVLHERFAPDGYMKAEPIVFVVTGEGATIIELENEMQPTLETKARFESGFKYELAKGEITLIDKVMYYQ